MITLTQKLPSGKTQRTDINPDNIVRTLPFEKNVMVITIDGGQIEVIETQDQIREKVKQDAVPQ